MMKGTDLVGSYACKIMNTTLDELISFLRSKRRSSPVFQTLLDLYSVERPFPDMSHFRLGPNMFDKISFQLIMLGTGRRYNKKSELIGHAIMTSIFWQREQEQLPEGWQGVVRCSYEDRARGNSTNTAVGLFVRVEHEYRSQGWAEFLLKEMKQLAKKQGFNSLIIPLRLPQRYEKRFAGIAFDDFVALRRSNNTPQDHWLRLHLRLGGKVLGYCETSHQHAMNLKDFYRQFESDPILLTGNHLVSQDEQWYNAYIDVERKFALINQECVWVEHRLQA